MSATAESMRSLQFPNTHIATPVTLRKTGPRTISQTPKFNKRHAFGPEASIP